MSTKTIATLVSAITLGTFAGGVTIAPSNMPEKVQTPAGEMDDSDIDEVELPKEPEVATNVEKTVEAPAPVETNEVGAAGARVEPAKTNVAETVSAETTADTNVVAVAQQTVAKEETATNAVPEAAAQDIRDENTDEIDLEEIDDSAEAAKRPTVKSAQDNLEFVDISCDDATLADILRQFRRTTKANIITAESTNLSRRVSAELKHVPWLDALESILKSRGFTLEPKGNIYYVNEETRSEPLFTKPFRLKHASADDLAKVFNSKFAKKDNAGKIKDPIANAFTEANVVVVTANEKTLKDCEDIILSIDKAVAQIYIEARFMELSSEAMHKLGVDWSTLESFRVTANGLSGAATANNGKAANYGTGLTSKSISDTTNNSTTDSKSSSASAAADGSTTTSASSSPSVSDTTSSSKSSTYAGLFPNAIGSAAKEGISAADMAWRNAYGFSGQFSASEFSLALSAFESLGEGKIFSNPRIIVSNGKEAKVDMTEKEPNVSVEANYTGTSSQNMNISTKLETIPGKDELMFAGEAFFSYGITLTVKPRISLEDGLINVEIVPTISEKVKDKQISGASENAVYTTYPIIRVKRLTTNFSMKDGATAVIGGLTQTTEQDVDNGIPYLRKIPWIGPKLFGWKSRENVQNEIIVCVTVGIANPGDLPKDIGLPKNAVIGREYVEGKRLEPGDRKGGADTALAIDVSPIDERRERTPKNETPAKKEIEPAHGSVIITPSSEQ